MPQIQLSAAAKRLDAELRAAASQTRLSGPVYHVAGLGTGFYFAYEQLRNAAQYRERHLLLRGAIERFLVRYARLDRYEPTAAELVTELTQAGYLKNDSIPQSVIATIDENMTAYAAMYQAVGSTKRLSRSTVANWIYQIASLQTENLLAPDPRGAVFMQFAYEHYYHAIQRGTVGAANATDQNYRISLYCAVQRAIFKSDLATTRYFCVTTSLPDLMNQPLEHFVQINSLIDDLYQAPMTNRLFRLVTRYGAPMHILRALVIEQPDLGAQISHRSETLSYVRTLCERAYSEAKKRLNSRILKTIFFVFLTKTLIGMSVEVPYDLIVTGVLAWTPLIINIFLPVLYMTTIGLRITTPSRQNTEVIADYIDRLLYDGVGEPVTYTSKRRVTKRSLNAVFTFIYAIAFTGSIALLAWALAAMDFNIVNGLIFFLFFSAVSFLGLRLRQSARELQILDEHEGILPTFTDFLSTPFIHVGHWLSDKYSKLNLVTLILDTAIEMPLKTTLRLMRQWVGFMRDRQEEL